MVIETMDKVREYLLFGVVRVWVIDPVSLTVKFTRADLRPHRAPFTLRENSSRRRPTPPLPGNGAISAAFQAPDVPDIPDRHATVKRAATPH
jgi:hypothetical protein